MKQFKINTTVTGNITIVKTKNNADYTKKGLIKILKDNFICDNDVQDILNELKVKDKVVF